MACTRQRIVVTVSVEPSCPTQGQPVARSAWRPMACPTVAVVLIMKPEAVRPPAPQAYGIIQNRPKARCTTWCVR
jgi:hypothetical protein